MQYFIYECKSGNVLERKKILYVNTLGGDSDLTDNYNVKEIIILTLQATTVFFMVSFLFVQTEHSVL